MHTASYEFLMKPKESAGCHQTLSARVGSGDETMKKTLMAHNLGRCFGYSSTPSLCCKTVNRVTHVAYCVAIMLNTANVMASFNVRLGS